MRYIDGDLLKQSIPSTKMDEFENCRYCRLLDEEQVKDLIDQQPTADVRENTKWISCDERLPKNSEKVLIVVEEAGDLYYELGSYEGNQWWWLSESGTNYWEMIDDVFAWLPIPRYGSDMRGEV